MASKYGPRGAVYYIKYRKVNGGYKAEGFARVFKTVTALKNYYTRTSSVRVKFIRG